MIEFKIIFIIEIYIWFCYQDKEFVVRKVIYVKEIYYFYFFKWEQN